MKILGISGSLRKGSYNTALLRAAVGLMPEGVQLEVGSIAGIPLYDGDLEAAQGIPPAVQALKTKIQETQGLLLVTPEYNNSIPGVFKNIGASPGGFGTILAQNAWLPVLRTLVTGRLQVSRAGNVFNAAGELTDDAARTQLRKYLGGFVDFIRNQAASG